jgi:hypothetical protein
VIAAQLAPAVVLLQVIGTVLALYGAGWLLLRPVLWCLDWWRNRVEPGWELADAQQRATDLMRRDGYR